MADIDMIPRSYREAQRVRAKLHWFAIALAAVVLAGALAAGLLRWRAAQMAPQLAQLRAAAAASSGDAARLAKLRERYATLEQSAAALAALRATGTVGRIAAALEGALGADLSVTGIGYVRSEQLIPATAGLAAAGDLSVQRPGAAGAAAVAETWRLARRLDLSGTAATYPALTAFLQRFSAQPGVAEAKLVDSAAPQGEKEPGAIGFNVTALVGAAGVKP